MPLDTSIARSIQPVQIADPMAMYAQMSQIKSAQNQNALAQYQLGAAQRAEKSQNVLADAYAQATDPVTGAIDYNKLTGLVAAGGGGAQLPGIQKSRLEQESASTKLLSDKLALLPNAYKMADTPEAYLALHRKVHADPVLGPWLNSVGATPEKGLATLQNAVQTGKFDDLRLKSMQSVSQLLEGVKPMTVASGSSVYNPQTGAFTQAPVAPAAPPSMVAEYTFAKTPDGGNFKGSYQDFVTARAAAGRAPAAPSAPRTQQVTMSDGTLGIINMDTGVITPATAGGAAVKGKDSSKTAVSEQQAAYNIGRVLTAANEIKNISSKDPSSAQPGAAEALAASVGMTGTANLARNANRQIVQGAQRDALDALLYLATGAAYNKEQLQGQMDAYIPAFTDKPEAIAAKKTRMTELIKSAKARAGKAWTPEMDAAMEALSNPSAVPAAAQGTGGFKYLGKESK